MFATFPSLFRAILLQPFELKRFMVPLWKPPKPHDAQESGRLLIYEFYYKVRNDDENIVRTLKVEY